MIRRKDVRYIKRRSEPNRLFLYDNRLFRTIRRGRLRRYGSRWVLLADFMQSDIFAELIRRNYVPNHQISDLQFEEEMGDVYEVEEIKHPSYAFEWSRAQLRDAVKMICELNLFLLESGSDMLVVDCNTCQVTFKHHMPMYIDIGSFSHAHKHWPRRYLRTAIKFVSGCDIAKLDKILGIKHYKQIIDILNSAVVKEEPNRWDKYPNRGKIPKSLDEVIPRSSEAKLLVKWARSIRLNAKDIVDIGSNDGRYSRLLAKQGFNVVAVDGAPATIARCYECSKQLQQPITSMYVDLTKPHDHSGRNLEYFNPRWRKRSKPPIPIYDWRNRIICDVALCSSITHHLYKAGFGFEKQAKLWNHIATKYLMVEYIDRDDRPIRRKKWVLGDEYNYKNFKSTLTQDWDIIETAKPERSSRIWFFCKKKQQCDSRRIWFAQ